MKINQDCRTKFEKQGYRLVGKHSAIKICNWTRQSIRDKGVCYKQKFYGINSHQCCQMSCSLLNCQNKCLHCWRDLNYTTNKRITQSDNPKKLIDDCIKEQIKILQGFKGNKKIDENKLNESFQPKHFAISLTGEATLYPKLAEFIKELQKRKISSFLVSNGLLPSKILELKNKNALPTQLYVSLNYPNEKIFRLLSQNKEKTAWKNLNKTLKILFTLHKKTRTVLRITLIKNLNMKNPEQYAKLIKKAQPMFVECKAYMHIGFSQHRLKKENMPLHEEVKEFANKIGKHCKYKIIDEKKDSRVVLLMKKNTKNRLMKF